MTYWLEATRARHKSAEASSLAPGGMLALEGRAAHADRAALLAEVDRLREALKPFAVAGEGAAHFGAAEPILSVRVNGDLHQVTIGDSELDFTKLRALIASREAAEHDFETKGAAAHYVAAVEASKSLKDWLGSNALAILEHIERVERNRDMWKGQCERQAEALRSIRAHD